MNIKMSKVEEVEKESPVEIFLRQIRGDVMNASALQKKQPVDDEKMQKARESLFLSHTMRVIRGWAKETKETGVEKDLTLNVSHLKIGHIDKIIKFFEAKGYKVDFLDERLLKITV